MLRPLYFYRKFRTLPFPGAGLCLYGIREGPETLYLHGHIVVGLQEELWIPGTIYPGEVFPPKLGHKL